MYRSVSHLSDLSGTYGTTARSYVHVRGGGHPTTCLRLDGSDAEAIGHAMWQAEQSDRRRTSAMAD